MNTVTDLAEFAWEFWSGTLRAQRAIDLSGAGDGARTRDPLLGKQMLYH
jgi:hypothetical protein